MAAHKGLILTLGGASYAPHVVTGVPGTYRPDIATPVGGAGQISIERAQKISDDTSCPLSLVDIADLEHAEKVAADDKEATKDGLKAASRRSNKQSATDRELVNENIEAIQ